MSAALIQQLVDALAYHTEQTRPIEQTRAAIEAGRAALSNSTAPHPTDSTRAAVVDHRYHWIPIDASAPRGSKVQIISRPAGNATYGRLLGADSFWTHWAPLPTFADDDTPHTPGSTP